MEIDQGQMDNLADSIRQKPSGKQKMDSKALFEHLSVLQEISESVVGMQ